MKIEPTKGASFEIENDIAAEVYRLYTNHVNVMSAKEIGKIYDLKVHQVMDIVTNVFNRKQEMIVRLKSRVTNGLEPVVMQLDKLICASFANLTVGDCIIEQREIVGINNDLFKYI